MNGEISMLLEAAITLNELFNTLVEGGFTENQALTIIAKVIYGYKEEL